MLRAEFPVQRNRTLYNLPTMTVRYGVVCGVQLLGSQQARAVSSGVAELAGSLP
jgi:hypothetical protein